VRDVFLCRRRRAAAAADAVVEVESVEVML